jgi:hypothetical protein
LLQPGTAVDQLRIALSTLRQRGYRETAEEVESLLEDLVGERGARSKRQ